MIEYFALKRRNDSSGLPTGYLEEREKEIGELVGKAYQIGLKLEGTTRENFFSSFDLLNKSFVKMELPEFHDKTFVVSYVIESFFRKGIFPTRKEVSERLVEWGENPNGKKHDLDKPLKNLGLKLRPEKRGPK
ncbi:hypothetical protein OAF99_02425 [Akkermansiaceae bacterium]|nr:hypothetical protein [Akkermansiaceae bacterium]